MENHKSVTFDRLFKEFSHPDAERIRASVSVECKLPGRPYFNCKINASSIDEADTISRIICRVVRGFRLRSLQRSNDAFTGWQLTVGFGFPQSFIVVSGVDTEVLRRIESELAKVRREFNQLYGITELESGWLC